jgi:hypothetical protein
MGLLCPVKIQMNYCTVLVYSSSWQTDEIQNTSERTSFCNNNSPPVSVLLSDFGRSILEITAFGDEFVQHFKLF